jgi:hypothetical protein
MSKKWRRVLATDIQYGLVNTLLYDKVVGRTSCEKPGSG